MDGIPVEVLERYHMTDIEGYYRDFAPNNTEEERKETAKIFYQTFLIQTDYIPNKIIESQITKNTIENYTDILGYRQYAREQLSKLMEG